MEHWNARHLTGPVAPARPEALGDVPLPVGGRALDLACGRGAVALWLAEAGLVVDAVDISCVALAAGRAASRAVRWIAADLDEGLPVTGPYQVVVCQRFWDPRLPLAALLAPDGLLVMTVLTGGRFAASASALLEVAAGLQVLHHEQHDRKASLVAKALPG